jgi:hypothetical protein
MPWIVTIVGLLVLWVFTGFIAIIIALRRSRPSGSAPQWIAPFSSEPVKRWALDAVDRIGWCLHLASSWVEVSWLRAVRGAKRWIVSLIPSRRTVFHCACTLLGVALVVISWFGFVNSNVWPVWQSFIVLSLGYALAAVNWFVPLGWLERHRLARQQAETDGESTPFLTPVSDSSLSLAAAPAVQINFITKPAAKPRPMVETVIQRQDSAHEARLSLNADTARLLHCVPCGKFFNVRGQGALGVRVIPCPQCGTALKKINGESTVTINIESNSGWAPIVSVLCQECRGLIDVPYAVIGRPVACPRCRAELSMPDVEDSIKQLQKLSSMIVA